MPYLSGSTHGLPVVAGGHGVVWLLLGVFVSRLTNAESLRQREKDVSIASTVEATVGGRPEQEPLLPTSVEQGFQGSTRLSNPSEQLSQTESQLQGLPPVPAC